jgi:putative membrane protein
MMDWGDGGWSWWWMIPMMTFVVVFTCAIVWAFVAVTRSADTTPKSPAPTPEAILNERFARGEIETAEYRERLDALHSAATTDRR